MEAEVEDGAGHAVGSSKADCTAKDGLDDEGRGEEDGLEDGALEDVCLDDLRGVGVVRGGSRSSHVEGGGGTRAETGRAGAHLVGCDLLSCEVELEGVLSALEGESSVESEGVGDGERWEGPATASDGFLRTVTTEAHDRHEQVVESSRSEVEEEKKRGGAVLETSKMARTLSRLLLPRLAQDHLDALL